MSLTSATIGKPAVLLPVTMNYSSDIPEGGSILGLFSGSKTETEKPEVEKTEINNFTHPQGMFKSIQKILPWATAILEAFGQQSFWVNIISSFGILWKALSSFSMEGLASASLDLIKYGVFAGLGGVYGISKFKTWSMNQNKAILGKNWAQILIGLIGVIGLQKLSAFFDKYIKTTIVNFFKGK